MGLSTQSKRPIFVEERIPLIGVSLDLRWLEFYLGKYLACLKFVWGRTISRSCFGFEVNVSWGLIVDWNALGTCFWLFRFLDSLEWWYLRLFCYRFGWGGFHCAVTQGCKTKSGITIFIIEMTVSWGYSKLLNFVKRFLFSTKMVMGR